MKGYVCDANNRITLEEEYITNHCRLTFGSIDHSFGIYIHLDTKL